MCKNCKNEFEAKRRDALFCSDKCRKAYKRNSSVKSEKPVIDDTNFVPNWKRRGFKNKEEAILFTIGNLLKDVPGVSISWKGRLIGDIK